VVFIEGIRVIAIRMILGAGQGRITRDIFTEAFALSLLAALLSVVAIKLTANLSSEFALDPNLLILLPLLGIMTALLAISVSVSSYRSGRVMGHLKGEVYGKRKRTDYRRIMVLLQFTSGVVMIACTLVIFLQMRFTRNKELGFDDQNIIYSFSPMTMNQRPDIPLKLEMFRDEMLAIPGVTSFCVSSSVPGNSIRFPGFMVNRVIDGINTEVYLEPVNVDAYYFNLYEIELISGEGFRMDENYNVDEVILNRRAAVELGFSDPLEAIGEILRAGDNNWQIIGVVENYHHYSLKEKLISLAFFKSLRWQASVGHYSFRLGTVSQQTIADIGRIWTRIYPGENFLYKFMEDSYREQYASDRSMGISFFIAAILALLTSCLGLLGLTRFNILKRTKEIGIRKTFGSSSALILKLLQAETLFMVLVASVTGVPVSWWISRRWLENFSFRIELDWWIFLAAILMLLVVAVLTTLVQTWRASRANPVETLKYE
jgi:putative ABC transport system permease protein